MLFSSSTGRASTREGKQVSGSYDPRYPTSSSHYEQLDPCKSSAKVILHQSANYFKRSTSEMDDSSQMGGYVSFSAAKAMSNRIRFLQCCSVKQLVEAQTM